MGYSLFLIKHGQRPESNKAPFHPVVICTKVDIAKRVAGPTHKEAWVWEQTEPAPDTGWLLCMWKGLQLTGNVDPRYQLPDGTHQGFIHRHTGMDPWPLLAGAVWWSNRKMPGWLADAGVVYPADRFTQERVLRDLRYNPTGPDHPVERPTFWPAPVDGESSC